MLKSSFTVPEICHSENDIRLESFMLSDTFGRLEVCSGGYWGSVCGDGANDNVAEVACRELNHAAKGENIK